MTKCTLYLVDDDPEIREGLTMSLESEYKLKSFSDAEAAIKAIKKIQPDLVLLDIGLPNMDGLEALKIIKEISSEIIVIMITAYEDINSVIYAMKIGAYDYVIKPLYLESLEKTLENAYNTIRLKKEVQILQEKYLLDNIPCFIGESDSIQEVMDVIGMVAKSLTTPILILGETGTGKELIAKAVHFRSPNFRGPFITVNCASIPKELTESELFGYERGAFSGAKSTGKKGLVEEAAKGTLFLDEVGELTLEGQAKLLRFLESGEFYKVGGTKKLHVQTRIVSATNKNLEEMIAQNLYRSDLYFRLSVIKIRVPSLNERKEDIIPLARYYFLAFCNKFSKELSKISSQVEAALMNRSWPGNIRELKNLLERGVLTCKGSELTMQDLELTEDNKNPKTNQMKNSFLPLSSKGIDIDELHKQMGKFYIEEAFKLAEGNECKAAKLLNLNHHTFRYRRKKLQET